MKISLWLLSVLYTGLTVGIRSARIATTRLTSRQRQRSVVLGVMCVSVLGGASGKITHAAAPPRANDTILPQAKIAPVDEAYRDPALVEMRKRLMVALSTCDTRAILALAEPDVTLDGWKNFDGGFKGLLVGRKRDRHFCSDLYDSLNLGGLLRSADRFESNYAALLFSGEPDREFPNGMYQVTIKAHVPVFDRVPARMPGETSSHATPMIAELSYDVVLAKPIPPGTWKRVEYAKGRFGYVEGKKLADPGGLVVKLQRGSTGWKIKELYVYHE